jgi:TM2 domain-containing membrane protein YozV
LSGWVQANPFVFNSRPGGATVKIEGYHSIVGRTPFNIHHRLNGIYRIKVSKEGFEAWKKEVRFAPGLNNAFNISLVPKTRWRAGLHSLICPGWGQFYSERPLKGLFVSSAFWTSVGIWAYSAWRYEKRFKSYEKALSELNNANLNNLEYEQQWENVLAKNRQAEDAYKLQKRWIWVTAAIFTYNVVDAILMFPDFNLKQNKLLLSIQPSFSDPEVALSICF